MKTDDLIAIDVHTHAEVSCRQPADEVWQAFEDAASKYFKAGKRPTIAETVAYYRERKIGLVMFTVDSEHELGSKRIPNEEVIDAARGNSDMMAAFARIDPHKGKMGIREARRLINEGGIKGFKFHPTVQGFYPNDRMAYGLYEVIAEHKLTALFHSGHSGIGTGMPGGGGFSGYENHHRASVMAVAGRGLVGVFAQGQRVHRLVGLVAQVFPAAVGAVCEHAAEAQDVVRLG